MKQTPLNPTFLTYDDRRQNALNSMSALPRGAAFQCAMDLRLHPSTVSGVLNGRTVNVERLAAIEAWLVKASKVK